MSYRNQYSGSPWQQGHSPFGATGYNQNYGYNDRHHVSHEIMNAGYNRNQGIRRGTGGIYSENGTSQMRNTGYGGPSAPRIYKHDRMNGRQIGRSEMQRKRLPQRDHSYGPPPKRANVVNSRQMDRNQMRRKSFPQRNGGSRSGPRSKRANLESNRRVANSRRRNDSKGESKSRNDKHEDIDNTDKPKEPTADLSDGDYDMFECWKSSDDEDGVGEKETTETQAAEKVSKTEECKSKKPLVCYVCKVSCSTKERLTKHQKSKSHTSKIDELLSIRRQKKKEGGEEVRESPEQNKKESSRKPGNWCTVCECTFTGNYLVHRRSKEHRTKREKKYVKCRPCKLEFSSSEEHRDHCKSEKHKQRSAEFHCLKNLASGSDEDEAAIQPAKMHEQIRDSEVKKASDEDEAAIQPAKMHEQIGDSEVKKASDEDEAAIQPAKMHEQIGDSEVKEASDDDEVSIQPSKEEIADSEIKNGTKEEEENATISESKNLSEVSKIDETKEKDEKKEDKDEKEKEVKKSKPKEVKYVGQSLVVPVRGYYCKLCHKFFKDVTVAKTKHCQSAMHIDAFKKAMAEAIEQEEERQKLVEKQDKEAAEAEELAAEIAEIERDAREAVRKELAAKKASISKEEDVEMKDLANETSKDDEEESANDDDMEDDLKEVVDDSEETEVSATEEKENNSEDSKEQESNETMKCDAATKDDKKVSTNEDGMENGLNEEMGDSKETEVSATENKAKDSENNKEQVNQEQEYDETCKDFKEKSTKEDSMENGVKGDLDIEMDDFEEAKDYSTTDGKGNDTEVKREELMNEESNGILKSDTAVICGKEESINEDSLKEGNKQEIDYCEEVKGSATKDKVKNFEAGKEEQVNEEQEETEERITRPVTRRSSRGRGRKRR